VNPRSRHPSLAGSIREPRDSTIGGHHHVCRCLHMFEKGQATLQPRKCLHLLVLSVIWPEGVLDKPSLLSLSRNPDNIR
jgi:hypothetical protein